MLTHDELLDFFTCVETSYFSCLQTRGSQTTATGAVMLVSCLLCRGPPGPDAEPRSQVSFPVPLFYVPRFLPKFSVPFAFSPPNMPVGLMFRGVLTRAWHFPRGAAVDTGSRFRDKCDESRFIEPTDICCHDQRAKIVAVPNRTPGKCPKSGRCIIKCLVGNNEAQC